MSDNILIYLPDGSTRTIRTRDRDGAHTHIVEGEGATRIALPGSSGAITAISGLFIGFSVRETAGAVAVFRLRDGTSTAGPILDTVSLTAGESRGDWFGVDPKKVITGIYYEKVSGTIEGAVFAR